MTTSTGTIVRVRRNPAGSGLASDAHAGDTTLEVGWSIDFEVAGATLDLDGNQLAYVGVDEDDVTINLAVPLTTDYEAGTPVLAIDATGNQAEEWLVDVDLGDGGEIPTVPDHALLALLREDEEMAGIEVLVESTPGGYIARSLPNTAPVPDGGYLATASVTTQALSTASVSNGDILNGTFEDLGGIYGLFAGWQESWWFGPLGEARWAVAEDGAQIAGSRSLAIVCDNDGAGRRVQTDRKYPVVGGQTVSVSVRLRGDRAVDRSATSTPTLAEVVVHTSIEGIDPTDLAGPPDVVWQSAIRLQTIDTTTADTVLVGSVVVPDGHTQMRLSIGAFPSGDGSGWTLVADEIHTTVPPDPGPQRIEDLTAGVLRVDSTDQIIVGGQTLTDWLAANYAPATSVPQVDYFTPTAIRTYDGSGNLLAPNDTYAYLGYSATGGNRVSVAYFDSTAIQAALAGRTVTDVIAFLWVSARGGAGAGIVPIGMHSDGTVRSTYGAITGKSENFVRQGGFSEGSGCWVPGINQVGWDTGAWKGLIFGPGQTAGGSPSSSLTYTNRIDGIGKPTCVQLKITST